jgi:hypothetical protein
MITRPATAPAIILSQTQRTALAECGKTGRLYKHHGVWRGSSAGTAINGNTIANLARDGYLTVTKNGILASAILTARGGRLAQRLQAFADEVIE